MTKIFLKKRTKREVENEEIVEDLDLSVDDDNVEDEDVIHNRRGKTKRGGRGDNLATVLPSEAHKLEGYDDDDDERGAHLEEEELALEANRGMRRKVIESDFNVSGIATDIRNKRGGKIVTALNVTPVVEAVERDYAALSSSERMAILQKEAPELTKMLDEMKQYLSEVKGLAKPLQDLFFQRRLSEADRGLVHFLETKVQLMLSYCMHVVFYLLLKTEGKKVAGHPVIDNLVEIRVYLEKLFPLEEKLQYSLNRLLSGKTTAAACPDTLRPLHQTTSLGFVAADGEAKKKRKQLEAINKAEEIEKEELSTMNRIQVKKSLAIDDGLVVDRKRAVSALGYHEDEDQYFVKLTAGSGNNNNGEEEEEEEGDEQGLSLIERLRRRQRSLADVARKNIIATDSDDNNSTAVVEDDDYDNEDYDESHSGEDEVEGDYEMLLEEEHKRQRQVDKEELNSKPKIIEMEVDRRKATKKIETHRGLTKSRPKDRKTPRTAQRRKYEKGMRIHKAQTRTVRPEPEGGFIGVPSIKSKVTQSIRF